MKIPKTIFQESIKSLNKSIEQLAESVGSNYNKVASDEELAFKYLKRMLISKKKIKYLRGAIVTISDSENCSDDKMLESIKDAMSELNSVGGICIASGEFSGTIMEIDVIARQAVLSELNGILMMGYRMKKDRKETE